MSTLNPLKAIEKKYVQSADSVFGYHPGQFFVNRIGLSSQMPNVIELYTNHEICESEGCNGGKAESPAAESEVIYAIAQ